MITSSSIRIAVTLLALATGTRGIPVPVPDRRTVDSAEVGNAESEALHGYVGRDAVAGVVDGKAYRQARGWMRFALRTFDDTEVTIACTFLNTSAAPASYDVLVEDSLIATRVVSGSATDTVVETAVPFVVTRGRSNIAIVIRAHDGATPALRLIRTIQDHNEFQHADLTQPLTRPSPHPLELYDESVTSHSSESRSCRADFCRAICASL